VSPLGRDGLETIGPVPGATGASLLPSTGTEGEYPPRRRRQPGLAARWRRLPLRAAAGETFGPNEHAGAVCVGRIEGKVHVVDVGIWAWVGFLCLILLLLGLDLFVFHREAHEVSFREATKFSIFWISLGLAFGVVVYLWLGAEAGGEYLAGYLIEKSLSVDNIFVFALIFTYFGVPQKYQHRVLFWGILGALVFRALFIAGGAALLERFHFTIYIFGAFLVLTGIRMALHRDQEVHPERNPVLTLFRRVVPMTAEYHGQRFTVVEAGKRIATPLMAVLVLIETSDILFAVDSIPAIFAVTDDPFIVFTSNAFAILGLRALYFMLAGMIHRFVYLKLGLAVVLVYVGVKMIVSSVVHIPIWASLAFIAITITVSIVASLRSTSREAARPAGSVERSPAGADEEAKRS
jgi:tellurite resistance protein TerC